MTQKTILRALAGETLPTPPIWMMRQAGRYLPEYKATRAEAGDFLSLCYNSDLAAEVTLQPIRRYGFDAAIMFADILLLPQALGADLWFVTGEGPRLSTITTADELKALKPADAIHDHLNPIYETLKILSRELPSETTLIGFAGAPWTVATYMIAGHGTPDQGPARQFSLNHPEAFQKMMDVLVDASAAYLVAQLKAGADAVQIFDSWASVLDEAQFQQWCVKPVKAVVEKVRAEVPDAKIIGFPKGVGAFYGDYAAQTGIDMLGLDWTIPFSFAKDLQKKTPVQGNLDPMVLMGNEKTIRDRTLAIIHNAGPTGHILNLGHGIDRHTPIDYVQVFFDTVQSFSYDTCKA